MKNSMLNELYYGKFSPWERRRIPDPEMTALMDQIDGILTHYQGLLPPEEYDKLEELQDLQAKVHILQEEEGFAYAFCAGARLMADVFGYQVP